MECTQHIRIVDWARPSWDGKYLKIHSGRIGKTMSNEIRILFLRTEGSVSFQRPGRELRLILLISTFAYILNCSNICVAASVKCLDKSNSIFRLPKSYTNSRSIDH